MRGTPTPSPLNTPCAGWSPKGDVGREAVALREHLLRVDAGLAGRAMALHDRAQPAAHREPAARGGERTRKKDDPGSWGEEPGSGFGSEPGERPASTGHTQGGEC